MGGVGGDVGKEGEQAVSWWNQSSGETWLTFKTFQVRNVFGGGTCFKLVFIIAAAPLCNTYKYVSLRKTCICAKLQLCFNCCLTTLQFSYFWELVIDVEDEGKATKVFASIFFLVRSWTKYKNLDWQKRWAQSNQDVCMESIPFQYFFLEFLLWFLFSKLSICFLFVCW